MENYFWVVGILAIVAILFFIKSRMPKQAHDPRVVASWFANHYQKSRGQKVPLVKSSKADGRPLVNVPYDIPMTLNSLCYVSGPISGTERFLTIRIEVVGNRIVTDEHRDVTGVVTPFIQRRGDNWSASGAYEMFRWFGKKQYRVSLTPGVHEIRIPLLPSEWKAVLYSDGINHPAEFFEALADVENIGLAFGGGTGLMHGVAGDGPATIKILEFSL